MSARPEPYPSCGAPLVEPADGWRRTHADRLVVHGKHAAGQRSRPVRGVKLEEETLAMADWLRALSADLEAVAAESQHARDALARFVK